MKVSVSEAKNKLTQLLRQVEKGERVTICRHGVPIADRNLLEDEDNDLESNLPLFRKAKTRD